MDYVSISVYSDFFFLSPFTLPLTPHLFLYSSVCNVFVFRFFKSYNQVVADGGSLLDTHFVGRVEKFGFFGVHSRTTRFRENLKVSLDFKFILGHSSRTTQ
jgi:hypothetical protein